MLKHRQPQVIARPQKAEQSIAVITQVFHQNSRQVLEQNAASRHLVAITVFREVRIAAVSRAALLDCLVKRQVLKGVQSVVVNEDLDRSL